MVESIASGVGQVAKLAQSVIPIISAINTEMKFRDTVQSVNVDFTPGIFHGLADIQQGVNEDDRIGNSILAKDINIRIRWVPDFSASPVNVMRIVVFVDKMSGPTNAAPDVSLLYEYSNNLESPFNKNYSDRFAIIRDLKLIATPEERSQCIVKIYKKLDFHIRYTGSGATTADYGPNMIYIHARSDQTTNLPAISYVSRLNYTDN